MPEEEALAPGQGLGPSTGGPLKAGLGRIVPEAVLVRIVPGAELALVRENRRGGSLVCFEDRRGTMLELELAATYNPGGMSRMVCSSVLEAARF